MSISKVPHFFLVFFSHVNFLCSTEDQGNCHDHLSSLFYQNQHRLSTDPHTTWLAFLSKRPSANTALFQEIKCLYILPPFDSFQTGNNKERKKERNAVEGKGWHVLCLSTTEIWRQAFLSSGQ